MRLKNNIKYSLVIPVLNEEDNLMPLYTRLMNVVKDWGKSCKIVLTADGDHSEY